VPEAADATAAPALSDDTIATNIPIATTDQRSVTQPSCPFCSPSALLSVLGSPCVHCPNRQQLLSDHRGLVERPRASRPKLEHNCDERHDSQRIADRAPMSQYAGVPALEEPAGRRT
jgi:hypothetical protein